MIETNADEKQMLVKIFEGTRKVIIAHPEEKTGDIVKVVPEFLERTGHFGADKRVFYHMLIQEYLYKYKRSEAPVDRWTHRQFLDACADILAELKDE